MKLENVAYAGEQLKNNVGEMAEKAREFSGKVADRAEEVGQDIRRGLRRTKAAAADAVEDARHGIKANPLTAVTVTALGAFAVGMLAGWMLHRDK